VLVLGCTREAGRRVHLLVYTREAYTQGGIPGMVHREAYGLVYTQGGIWPGIHTQGGIYTPREEGIPTTNGT